MARAMPGPSMPRRPTPTARPSKRPSTASSPDGRAGLAPALRPSAPDGADAPKHAVSATGKPALVAEAVQPLLEAADLGFRLGAAQVADRRLRFRRLPEDAALLAGHLAHGEPGRGLDV